MAVWTPYLIAYLCGVATPILIVRNLLKNSEDGSSFFFNVVLAFVFGLILLAIWLGFNV